MSFLGMDLNNIFKSNEPAQDGKNEYLYTGQVLHVDLTRNEIHSKVIPQEFRNKYIGGWGLAVKYLYDLIDPRVAPLSSENAFVIMTGPVCGTLVPMSARTCLVSKSPKTHTIFESNIGGAFGPELKFAGFDGIVVIGKADKPVYLKIENDKVSLEDASPIMGKGIFDTEEWLKNEFDFEAKTLSIGSAGENLIDFSCVGSESYRQMGRGGAGALFGSKNLKAIAVRGTNGVRVREMTAFYKKMAEHTKTNLLTEDNLWAYDQGTASVVDVTNEMGILPTKNFTKGVYSGHQNLNADSIINAKIGDRACISCPMACGKFTSINGTQVEGPEYETLCLGGSNCEVNDLEAVIKFNRLCDDFGLDTMSAGVIIGLAMDITESDIHDYGVRFGDKKEYLSLIEEIATLSTRRGKDLALGAQKLAAKHGADEMAAHAKNLEIPAYEPRGSIGMALAYATSERGACHLRAFPAFDEEPFTVKNMANSVMESQNNAAVKWSMGLCDFWETIDSSIMADFLTTGLGKKIETEDLEKAGERIWNLTRLFNQKAGFTASHDTLSNKFFKKELQNGPHKGQKVDHKILDQMKTLYYELRGWDQNGQPSKEKLSELGL